MANTGSGTLWAAGAHVDCADCGRWERVTQDEFPLEASSITALTKDLRERGWSDGRRDHLWRCPECAHRITPPAAKSQSGKARKGTR